MRVEETSLPGVLTITPAVHTDARGSFRESWQRERYTRLGLPERWEQDNISVSRRGVLRGLHFQHPVAQGKLVTAIDGEILDVAVDVRTGSPTFGRSVAVSLSASNARQLWIPEGFAHGFLVMSEQATVFYKVSQPYDSGGDRTIAWNDERLGIQWPVSDPIMSAKDMAGRVLADFAATELPRYQPAS